MGECNCCMSFECMWTSLTICLKAQIALSYYQILSLKQKIKMIIFDLKGCDYKYVALIVTNKWARTIHENVFLW